MSVSSSRKRSIARAQGIPIVRKNKNTRGNAKGPARTPSLAEIRATIRATKHTHEG